jgi:pentatricopeptide repeat protein
VNGLIRLYKDMSVTKCKPDKYTFLSMIEGFGKEKDVENMLIAFKAYKGIHVNQTIVNTLEITRPDSTIYTTVLKILAQCKDKEKVLHTIEEMKHRKIRPNSATYNALIEGNSDLLLGLHIVYSCSNGWRYGKCNGLL